MYDLDKFSVKVVEEKAGTYAKFEIAPLPKGFGYTVGNAIRRILLSSISGAAITSVKINGVKHEYSEIDGVQQDVLTVVLNLKNISVKSFVETPVVLTLNKKGKKGSIVEVKASDFSENSDVEIINPDFVIAELTSDKAFLDLEIVIEKGMGYALPDESKRSEIGVIPVDSLFSPVKHVNMDVEQARLGQQTDLDKVTLEVYTNGTSTPKEVFLESVEIFDLIANRLVDTSGGDSENNSLEVEKEEETVVEEKRILISELGLSTRLTNALLNSGITDLMMLEGRNRKEILSFKGMGKKSSLELEEILNKYDIEVNS